MKSFRMFLTKRWRSDKLFNMKVRAPFEFEEFKEGKGAHMFACEPTRIGFLGFFMSFAGGGFTLCTSAVEAHLGVVTGYKHLTVYTVRK